VSAFTPDSPLYNVLVGQEIQLLSNVPGWWDMYSSRWAAIGGYIVSDAVGTVIPLPQNVGYTPTPTFYYSITGVYEVVFHPTDPRHPSRSMSFNVSRPRSTFQATIVGASQFNQQLQAVALTDNSGGYGITYTGTVVNTSAQYAIEIGIIQLAKPARVVTDQIGETYHCPANNRWFVDTNGNTNGIYVGRTVNIPPGETGTIKNIGDRPSLGVASGNIARVVQVQVDLEEYKTFLMYRVTGQGNSVWVPMEGATWHWSITATKNGFVWDTAAASAFSFGLMTGSVGPTWYGYVGTTQNLLWGEYGEVPS